MLTLLLNLLIIILAALVRLFFSLLHISFMFDEQCLANGRNCVKHWFEVHDGFLVLAIFFSSKQNNRFPLHSFTTCAIFTFFFILASYHRTWCAINATAICNYTQTASILMHFLHFESAWRSFDNHLARLFIDFGRTNFTWLSKGQCAKWFVHSI